MLNLTHFHSFNIARCKIRILLSCDTQKFLVSKTLVRNKHETVKRQRPELYFRTDISAGKTIYHPWISSLDEQPLSSRDVAKSEVVLRPMVAHHH